jgi:hypothetical protein
MIPLCLALIEQGNTGNIHKKNVLICIACSYQPEHIQEQEVYQSKYQSINVSFQVLPSLAQNWCLDKTFTERYKAGLEPCAPLALHLESALKHVHNAAKHFIFIEKLDFSESGSKPAYAEECSEGADNELSDKKSSHSLNLSDSVVASEFVDKTVLSGLQSLSTQQNFHFYDYKTYAAIPRAFCEPDESATLLDLAGSRGLKVNRPFTAVDFLLRWQKPALVEKNIIEFMKAG